MSTESGLTAALQEAIQEALGNSKFARAKASAVLAAVEQVLAADVYGVHVHGARGAVGTVTAYGLSIDVDANGRAAYIELPDGAEAEWYVETK